MVKLTTKRGTAVEKIVGVFGHPTLPEAQKLQEQRLQLSGPNTVLTIQRGTGTIQAKDIPVNAGRSLKGQTITTNRGTSRQVL